VENDGILTAEDVSTRADRPRTRLRRRPRFLLELGLLPLRSIDRHSPNCSAFSRQRSKTEDEDEFEDDYGNDCEERRLSARRHHSGNAPEALAEVQRNWLLKLRTEKG
jgi:hypothetical protein